MHACMYTDRIYTYVHSSVFALYILVILNYFLFLIKKIYKISQSKYYDVLSMNNSNVHFASGDQVNTNIDFRY